MPVSHFVDVGGRLCGEAKKQEIEGIEKAGHSTCLFFCFIGKTLKKQKKGADKYIKI